VVVFDVETNALDNPDKIWVIVCKDVDTQRYEIFRRPSDDREERERFGKYIEQCDKIIGHNCLGYDIPVLGKLLSVDTHTISSKAIDTLVVSKLVNYSRGGHSIEDYGLEFGIPKGAWTDFSQYSEEMEKYCVRDVDICERIYLHYRSIIDDSAWSSSLEAEHSFQTVVNNLHDNGFGFDIDGATKLLVKVTKELSKLDEAIHASFPPRLRLIREVHPCYTKHGTLHRKDFRWVEGGDLSEYNGGPFSRCRLEDFNPASHRQVVDVLHAAGWKPVERTATAIKNGRNNKIAPASLVQCKIGLDNGNSIDYHLDNEGRYGWKISEPNLLTLPNEAPAPAKSLARRILVESRRRTLTEWLNLTTYEIQIEKDGIAGIDVNGTLIQNGVKNKENVDANGVLTILKNQDHLTEQPISNTLTDYRSKILIECLKNKKVSVTFVKENVNYLWITVTGQTELENFFAAIATVILDGTKSTHPKYKITSHRIHGRFFGIGAWSGRMAHQKPNTANIPNSEDTQGKTRLYGAEMRSLWCAPPGRYLVGVDAEGIQLRIFAHYIDDPEFTEALVNGKKDNKTDPHSLNQRILGSVCKSRAAAKRFIYALLLGAGIGKLAEILDTDKSQTQAALDRLARRYSGFAKLKETIIPEDAKRGYFIGLDGRHVPILGNDEGNRRHLAMSGYLQNGEAVIMKHATLRWHKVLCERGIEFKLVNFVHDEWQTECEENLNTAIIIANEQADSLRWVGEQFGLRCPLAGSFWNEDTKKYTIGKNWKVTH
jgi:DNA polymerase I-like protein with 3'-5' exonuclease and polymerase domains